MFKPGEWVKYGEKGIYAIVIRVAGPYVLIDLLGSKQYVTKDKIRPCGGKRDVLVS